MKEKWVFHALKLYKLGVKALAWASFGGGKDQKPPAVVPLRPHI